MITAIRNNTDNTLDNRMAINRNQKWQEKHIYEEFRRLEETYCHSNSIEKPLANMDVKNYAIQKN